MTSADMQTVTAWRLAAMANGYAVLPNLNKVCMLSGWPSVVATPELIRRWGRSRRWMATGIRLEDDQAMIDADVDHPILEKVLDALFGTAPQLKSRDVPLLVRHGRGTKLAIMVRTDQVIGRMATTRWQPPGAGPDDATHSIEIFGSGSKRQFGVHGPHSYNDDGSVAVEYRWEGRSPADTPTRDLPLVTKEQLSGFLERCSGLFERAGWNPCGIKLLGRNFSSRRTPGTKPYSSPERLAEALAVVPAAEDYNTWNKVGMAIYRATKGSAAGLALWDAWSRKAENYGGTDEKWKTYRRSPPEALGAGTIFHMAGVADPLWRRRAEEESFRVALERFPKVLKIAGSPPRYNAGGPRGSR